MIVNACPVCRTRHVVPFRDTMGHFGECPYGHMWPWQERLVIAVVTFRERVSRWLLKPVPLPRLPLLRFRVKRRRMYRDRPLKD